MASYNPPHEAYDTDKLSAIVEAIRANKTITPVVVSSEQAITGSHRVRAFEIATEMWHAEKPGWEDTNEPILPVVEIDDETLLAACKSVGAESFAEVVHFDDLYVAIEELSDCDEIKAAVADQY